MLKSKVLLAFSLLIIISPVSIFSDINVPGKQVHMNGILIAQTDRPLTFTQVVDNLDAKRHTKFHVQEYIRMNRGMEVRASGKVVDVVGGRRKVRILVVNEKRRTIKGFNIVLTMLDDIEKASRLQKGQSIQFRGYLHNYKADRHGGIIIYLRGAQLL